MQTFLTIVNGEKELQIPISLDDTQIRQFYLAAAEPESAATIQLNGWEAPTLGSAYFYIDQLGEAQTGYYNEADESRLQADYLYNAVNCYSSEVLAKEIARADNLFRAVRRFAIEHRVLPMDYRSGGYTILYNYETDALEVGMTGPFRGFGDLVFETEHMAQEAINEFRAELIWYFTEMIDKL